LYYLCATANVDPADYISFIVFSGFFVDIGPRDMFQLSEAAKLWLELN